VARNRGGVVCRSQQLLGIRETGRRGCRTGKLHSRCGIARAVTRRHASLPLPQFLVRLRLHDVRIVLRRDCTAMPRQSTISLQTAVRYLRSSTRKQLPPPSRVTHLASPPCRRAIWRTSESPNPTPPSLSRAPLGR